MKKIVDMEKWHQRYKFVMNFYDERYSYEYGYMNATDHIDDWLEAQPNAEEKRGKWLNSGYERWACSCCGYVCIGDNDYSPNDFMMHYCPNCGAKMDLKV